MAARLEEAIADAVELGQKPDIAALTERFTQWVREARRARSTGGVSDASSQNTATPRLD
jgi:hypothetical protein